MVAGLLDQKIFFAQNYSSNYMQKYILLFILFIVSEIFELSSYPGEISENMIGHLL